MSTFHPAGRRVGTQTQCSKVLERPPLTLDNFGEGFVSPEPSVEREVVNKQ